MKKINLTLVFAVSIILFNGTLFGSDKQKEEEETDSIEVIEANDTTGVISVAKEAARKIINDAKITAENLKKDANRIYDKKRIEAEQNADKIIATGKEDAKKAKKAYLKAALEEKLKEVKIKTDKMIVNTKQKVALFEKQNNEKIKKAENKIVANAKKAAGNITIACEEQIKNADTYLKNKKAEADTYLKNKKDKADTYFTTEKTEADKKLKDYAYARKKQIDKSGLPVAGDAAKAQKLLQKMIAALYCNDYKKFSENFTVELKKNFTEERFNSMSKGLIKNLGKLEQVFYLGFATKGPLKVYLWKGFFSKAKKKNRDAIFKLDASELDGKITVFGFGILI